MRRLEGKVAIVTGGATGIGEAIAKLFAVEGAKVVVNGFPEDPAAEVAESIRKTGGEASAFVADVSNEGAAMECVAFAVSNYGKLDIPHQQCRRVPGGGRNPEFPDRCL
jgi:NAD(P)-dependent dehydrogenase (short-subunit alcohol dehydrogenase family)